MDMRTDLTAVPHAGLRNQILKNQVKGGCGPLVKETTSRRDDDVPCVTADALAPYKKRRKATEVQVTPVARGLRGMNEYRRKVATSCVLQCAQVHQAGTFSRQLGWVFVGTCHPSVHGPPALQKENANSTIRVDPCEGAQTDT